VQAAACIAAAFKYSRSVLGIVASMRNIKMAVSVRGRWVSKQRFTLSFFPRTGVKRCFSKDASQDDQSYSTQQIVAHFIVVRLCLPGSRCNSRRRDTVNGQTQQQTDAGSTGAPSDEMGHFVAVILGSTEDGWTDVFAQAGKTYQPPKLVLFDDTGAIQSASDLCKPRSVITCKTNLEC
jgi:hypothetical protein